MDRQSRELAAGKGGEAQSEQGQSETRGHLVGLQTQGQDREQQRQQHGCADGGQVAQEEAAAGDADREGGERSHQHHPFDPEVQHPGAFGNQFSERGINQGRGRHDRAGDDGGEEFDVSEYSLSEFSQRFTRKECPFVAIPVFPSIAFRMGYIAINKKSGIKTPKDLEGKRIGVPLYTMTAAIFINGILHHEFGVDLTKVRWVQGAMNEAGSHGSPTVLPLLKRMSIENNKTRKTLGQLLAAGEIDATLGTSLPEEIRTDPNVARLFTNFVDVDKDLYKRKGIYPIMHTVAIKKSVYERYPFVATSLYDAFVKSKEIALRKLFNLRAVRYMTPFLMREIDDIWEVFNGDPWPYGVEPNRRTIEALITYQQTLGLTDRAVKVDDLFVPTYG